MLAPPSAPILVTAATPTSTTQPPSLPEVGSTLGGQYRLTKIVGTGGMGAVYLARHETFDEDVAVKVLLPSMANDEEARRRFEREARILFKLRSSRVCRVIDVGTEGDVPFMVMEYLQGQDLGYRMESQKRFELATAVEITLQLCEAIAEAHVRDVVHRDLKPENIFLEEGDEISLKLLDFGLSKDRSSRSAGGSQGRGRKLTGTKQVFGTPFYMAPEQWMAARKVGPASDQWAIGAILFEMLAGRPPFYAEAFAAVCTGILHDPTPSIREVRPEVPPGLDTALMKALEKDPRHRFAHVGAMATALSAFAGPGASRRVERITRMLDDMAPESEEETNIYVPRARGTRAPDMHATVPDVRSRTASQRAWDVEGARPIGARAAMALAAGALVAVLTGVVVAGSRPEPRRAAQVGLVPVIELPDDLGEAEEVVDRGDEGPVEDDVADDDGGENDEADASAPGSPAPRPVRIRRPRPKPKPKTSIFDDR